MSTDFSQGIPLKDGSFTFPPALKCRVDRKALKEIPRNFEICKQGVEALNDLFYEAPPEKKEGVLVQKAVWENVQERIQNIQVFNSRASYTDITNQVLPIRVNLPKGNQNYPLDQILTKDLSNPYLEKKKFARELLDIVSAIRTMREEKLFKYENFHIYPTKEAFVLTDNSTGERHLTVAIHSICPDNVDDKISSEELCMMAIKDLIRQRWDYSQFGRVLKAQNLTAMFMALRHLSRDVPTVERIAVGTGYAAVYALIGFVIFSILMLLSSFTPWNRATLQEIEYSFYNAPEPTKVTSALVKGKDDKKKYEEVVSHRIVMDMGANSAESIEVVGTYKSSLRLDTMGGLFIFDKLSLTNFFDGLYNLSFEKPIGLDNLKHRDLEYVKPNTKEETVNNKKVVSRFEIKNVKKDAWGRERFELSSGKDKLEQTLPLEVIIQKPGWTLSSSPEEISFKQTTDEKASAVDRELRVFANSPPGAKTASDEVNKNAYFRVSLKNLDSPEKIPIEVQFLKSVEGPIVATISFTESYYDGGLPTTRSIKVGKNRRNSDDEEEEEEEEEEDLEDEEDDRPRRTKISTRDTDVFEFNGNKYYNLLELPEFTTIKVAAKQLPTSNIECTLHIAVPGINDSVDIPITFNPKEDILLKEAEMTHVRKQVSGLAYPIEVQQRVWSNKPKKIAPVRLSDFVFEIDAGDSKQPIENFGAMGIGFQVQADRKLYFYNTKTGKTHAIQNYNLKDGVLYFAADEKNYEKGPAGWFQPKEGSSLNEVAIRRDTAQSITQLYVVVLTEKNVEKAKLTLKKNNRTEVELPISARSEEALKIVTWRQLAANQTYKKEDWINKEEDPGKKNSITVEGPLGGLRYNIVLFSGDEAVEDVSNKTYLRIDDPSILNMVYQTVDGDWFTNNDKNADGLKSLKDPGIQLKFLKRTKDKRPPYTLLDSKEASSVAPKDLYFLASQEVIGQVNKYYAVAGSGVAADTKESKTSLTFYLPEKDMEASVDVVVSRVPENEILWSVVLDQENKQFKISVNNYEISNAEMLAKQIRFMLTCAAVQLLHNGYHKEEGKVHRDDSRWAQIIAWALQSVGDKVPSAPSTEVLGTLAEQLGAYINNKEEFGIKLAYQLMRETLFLSWSGKTEDLLNDYLGLSNLEENIAGAKKVSNDLYSLSVEPYAQREFPILVNSPKRYKNVTFQISFDKLLMDKTPSSLYELNESYYRGIPSSFATAPRVKEYLTKLYPYPDAFPEQTKTIGSNIQISERLFNDLLQYSLWEERLKNSVKAKNKFWVAIQSTSKVLADVDGKIDVNQANLISSELQKRIESYLLNPVQVRRVYWQELQDKVRTPEERDKNRDDLSKQEVEGLLKFLERSMMPQFTSNDSWYSSFDIVLDRLTLDQCPYGNKWVYIKTYRPKADGLGGEAVKLNIFKRNGMNVDPYPSRNYSVEILNYGDDWGGGAETKIIRVTGIDAFLGLYKQHTSSEIKGGPDERIRLDIFYDEREEERKITRAGGISPPVVNFQVHPKSVLLFEISGYQISPDRVREVVRNKGLDMYVKRGTKNWKWTFSVDNGPIISPYAFGIQETEVVENTHDLSLVWKEDPAPAENERNFTSLQERYDMEFLFIDAKEKLPEEAFFPYKNFYSMATAYDEGTLQPRRMNDLLNKLFSNNQQLKVYEKFEWTEELAKTYDKKHTLLNNNKQMFSYEYDESHMIKVAMYENLYFPEEFKNKHPQLKVNQDRTKNQDWALIWKVSPKEGKSRRGFPKYIIQKSFVTNREQIISNE